MLDLPKYPWLNLVVDPLSWGLGLMLVELADGQYPLLASMVPVVLPWYSELGR